MRYNLPNMAGRSIDRTNDILREELRMAGINIVENPAPIQNSEVNTIITGELDGWTFKRAWQYWVCKGDMPIDKANEIYAIPAGKTYVRAGGHCCCPEPITQADWITPDNKTVAKAEEEKDFARFVEKGIFTKEDMDKYAFSDNPESLGAQAFVRMYHVDSELGLYLLAEKIKELGAVHV